MKMIDWKLVHNLVNNAARIVISTHENPDGDGLGCSSAMRSYLDSIGKDSRILSPSPLPDDYQFLAEAKAYDLFDTAQHGDWLSKVDLAIIFDVGDYRRLGAIGPLLKEQGTPMINIDHHAHTTNGFFDYNFIDLDAAATGEMIYDFFKLVYPEKLTPAIAEGLYAAILTDTGSFRYSNTNIRCHEVAIECIRSGIKPHKIHQQVYESSSIARIRLLGLILNSLQFERGGELAWFKIDRAMLSASDATQSDVEGFTDFIRTIKGVEVALMVFQNGSDTCRINFRSKGHYSIHRAAQQLGGGGHPFAAGAVIPGTLNTVIPRVLEVTQAEMEKQNTAGNF